MRDSITQKIIHIHFLCMFGEWWDQPLGSICRSYSQCFFSRKFGLWWTKKGETMLLGYEGKANQVWIQTPILVPRVTTLGNSTFLNFHYLYKMRTPPKFFFLMNKWHVCWFAQAPVTKYNRVGGLNKTLFPHSFGAKSPTSRCWQAWFPWRPFSVAFFLGWPQVVCSLCMCIPDVSLCVKISSSYKETVTLN